jgi:ATP-dependent DNA ligase
LICFFTFALSASPYESRPVLQGISSNPAIKGALVFFSHSSAFACQSARSRTPSIDTPVGRGFPGAARKPTYRAMLRRTSSARSRRAPPAGFIRPCQPFLVVRPPADPGWLHEVKHDGYRIVARKQGESVSLWTRYATDFTNRLPRIAEAIGKLPAE